MGDENNLEPETTPTAGSPTPNVATHGGEPGETAPLPPSSGGRPDSKGLSPGQRLAAKKAQKARQKQDFKAEIERKEEEKREQEREEAERILGRGAPPPALPDDVQQVAGEFSGFMQEHRGRIVAGVVGVFLLGLLFIALKDRAASGSAAQADLLRAALETAQAPVDAEGKPEGDKPVFKTREDKLKQSASMFASVAKDAPDSVVAGWARAAEASSQLQLGKAKEAAKLFEGVYKAHGQADQLSLLALEGWAISLEAEGKVDEAVTQFQKLVDAEGGAAKDFAEYHLARLKLAKGDQDGAKTLLKGVYDRLLADTSANARSRFLRGEVEARLSELDSSLVQESGGGGQQFSQEQIQRLLEQLKKQQGNAQPGAEGE